MSPPDSFFAAKKEEQRSRRAKRQEPSERDKREVSAGAERHETIRWIVARRERADIHGSPEVPPKAARWFEST